MNDPHQLPFPYKPPAIHVKQVSRKLNNKEGIKRPIEKYGWMSEGGLKPIEKGLPLIFGTKFSHSFEDIEIAHKRFTDFVQQYKKFKTGDEFDDSIDNDENEENEENENHSEEESDIEGVYNPFKYIIDQVALQQKSTVEDPQPRRTGINTPSIDPKKDANSSIINSIAPIKFSSVKPSHEIKKPLYMSPFCHPQSEARVRVPTKSTVPLLKQQLNRVFKPGGVPFENVDKSEDFPTTMLLPMIDETAIKKRGKSELSMYRRTGKIINPKNDRKFTKKIDNNKKKISFPNNTENDTNSSLLITEMKPDMYSKETFLNEKSESNTQNQNDNDENSQKAKNDQNSNKNKYDDLKNVPSTLLDPTIDDIFWTKNKVPFTRDDINHIFSWQIQNDAIMTLVDEKRQKKLDEREKALVTTLESKEAFEHAIDLVDKECERIVKLGPGKSIKNKKSFWIEAAKYAKKDKSSLMYRKKKWDEFVKEVYKSFNLLVKKSENKDENFYSSPYFSSISQSNTNLTNANLANASSKPSLNKTNDNSSNQFTSSDKKESEKSEVSDEDIYTDNIMIGSSSPKSYNDHDENYNGLAKNQVDFILIYKAEVMSGREVNSTTFWNVIQPFQAADFTHTEFCVLVEILRSQLNVTKSEVFTYLEEKEYPTLFYHLVSTNPEFQPITDDDDEIAQQSNKKMKKDLISHNKSSMIFDAMQKKQQIFDQNQLSFEKLPHQ